ncbi:uncharacterized protein TRIADDRAFT_53368 [Trichoplax adhaerens]|uniref:BTB domain-containing protein n=1 Tax=Trichoplax adhaerens TaxID=10228 RepID=B3RP16_TRIAD|nr:hypothetical protein TRIADDRAFT_53368 [Trichoplax adhaerens]EDV27555.1 hypothetical protein TRIADDRAFT_53368 [Trichoplax adhaerens]|eukprot:XP_002109389.1 hypothetical protein TRIADDRAFT_53368 [Trichoplax adhaerens]
MNSSSQNLNLPFALNERPRGGSRSSSTASADISSNGIKHRSRKHAAKVLHYFNKLRRKGQLCDVTLVVESKRFYCHRGILAACSPYFRAVFNENSSINPEEEICIQDADEESVEAILDYMYTANIIINENNAHILFPIASLMQLDEILDTCSQFLRDQLTLSNCLSVRTYADDHSSQDLYQTATAYIQENFTEIVLQTEFLALSITQLVAILRSGNLNVPNEEFIYQAIIDWARYDIKQRRDQLHQALQHVRLSSLNPRYLVTVVSQEPLIRCDEKCRDLVDQAKNILLLPEAIANRANTTTVRIHQSKQPPVTNMNGASTTMIYVVGGWSHGKADNTVEVCHACYGNWKVVSKMNKPRYGVGVAVLEDSIFAIGGHDGKNYLDTVEQFNPKTKYWSLDIATTRTCHTSHGVATVNNCIYAIGGQDGVSSLNLVERYDPHHNEWYSVVPMKSRRLGLATAVVNNCIYAAGGFDGTAILSTVERLDPRENQWVAISPMNKRRKHHGATVINGILHVAGGRDDSKELKTVEYYDSRNNTWIPTTSMTTLRSGMILTAFNDQLAVIGGFDGVDYLKSVEILDRELEEWKYCSGMNHSRLGAGVAVLESP